MPDPYFQVKHIRNLNYQGKVVHKETRKSFEAYKTFPAAGLIADSLIHMERHTLEQEVRRTGGHEEGLCTLDSDAQNSKGKVLFPCRAMLGKYARFSVLNTVSLALQ